MEEENKVAGKSRREFVKTAAQVAVTAPAVAMLLNASTKPASAQAAAYLGDDSSLSDQAPTNGDTFPNPGNIDDLRVGDDVGQPPIPGNP